MRLQNIYKSNIFLRLVIIFNLLIFLNFVGLYLVSKLSFYYIPDHISLSFKSSFYFSITILFIGSFLIYFMKSKKKINFNFTNELFLKNLKVFFFLSVLGGLITVITKLSFFSEISLDSCFFMRNKAQWNDIDNIIKNNDLAFLYKFFSPIGFFFFSFSYVAVFFSLLEKKISQKYLYLSICNILSVYFTNGSKSLLFLAFGTIIASFMINRILLMKINVKSFFLTIFMIFVVLGISLNYNLNCLEKVNENKKYSFYKDDIGGKKNYLSKKGNSKDYDSLSNINKAIVYTSNYLFSANLSGRYLTSYEKYYNFILLKEFANRITHDFRNLSIEINDFEFDDWYYKKPFPLTDLYSLLYFDLKYFALVFFLFLVILARFFSYNNCTNIIYFITLVLVFFNISLLFFIPTPLILNSRFIMFWFAILIFLNRENILSKN